MKLDRQEIVAVVVALQEWLAMDHRARFEGYERRVRRLEAALDGIPRLALARDGDPVTGLRLVLDERALGKSAAQIAAVLKAGNPSIWVRCHEAAIVVSVATIQDGDEPAIAGRVKDLL
jgi:L-seryl-tRNA(Ser) seleniumtransferase